MKDSKPKNSKQGPTSQKAPWILVGVIIAVVIVAAGVAIYLDRVAPFRTTIVSVDGEGVSMRTFVRRAKLSGQEPLAMLQKLAEEQVVKLVAPNPPYNIQVDDEDIDNYLREVARGGSASITDADYQWTAETRGDD